MSELRYHGTWRYSTLHNVLWYFSYGAQALYEPMDTLTLCPFYTERDTFNRYILTRYRRA